MKNGKPGPGHLGAALEVEEPGEARDVPVRRRRAGRRRPGSPWVEIHDVLLGRPRPPGRSRAGRFGSVSIASRHVSSAALSARVPLLDLGRDRLHLGDLGDELRRALRERRHRRRSRPSAPSAAARPPGAGRATRRRPPSTASRSTVEVLLGDRRAHELGRFADQFGVEHGGEPSGAGGRPVNGPVSSGSARRRPAPRGASGRPRGPGSRG